MNQTHGSSQSISELAISAESPLAEVHTTQLLELNLVCCLQFSAPVV